MVRFAALLAVAFTLAMATLALAEQPPKWADEPGPADPAELQRLLASLGDAAGGDSGRSEEQRYARALLLLEPGSSHDVATAREELLALSRSASPEWAARALHALGFIHERDGRLERARDAYGRVLVDYPSSDAAVRAAASLARSALASGETTAAAVFAERALASEGATPGTRLLREAAMRSLVRASTSPAASEPVVVPIAQEVNAFLPVPDGLYIASAPEKSVVFLDSAGNVQDRWTWQRPIDALASDGWGRVYAAAEGKLWRLASGGHSVEIASFGEFDPPGAIAPGGGGFWLIDRRGQRLARLPYEGGMPQLVAEDREVRITALAWDGRRLLGLDQRGRTVRQLWSEGNAQPREILTLPPESRADGLSVDAAGNVLVADHRGGLLRVFDPRAVPLFEFSTAPFSVERVAAAALMRDGSIHVMDGRQSRWLRWP